jgi:hypothetical protein
MKEVTVTQQNTNDQEWQFDVTVNSDSTTHHTVTLTKDYWTKLTNETTPPEELINLSFKFLMNRESNESILRNFNLEVIQTYFPEYESDIKRKLNHD